MKQKQRNRAFTLLELTVVMGIVAVTMVMVVLTVLKTRDRVGDVTCQNNLRQLLSALEMYNVDNNGSMPYGFFYVGSGPPTWGPPAGGNNEYISWASELNKYFTTTATRGDGSYAPAFQCPQAQQQAVPHQVSYVINFIVGISPYYEMFVGMPPRAQTRPPSLHLMLRDVPGTAIFWDTPIKADVEAEGYLVGADIDGQRFWEGARVSQYRYFSPHDPYSRIPPGIYGNNRRIVFNLGGSTYKNIDPPAGVSFPYQGNLRFRHNNQTQCNAAFSDGSVRQFTAVFNPDNSVASHDAIRRYFMINWPPGVTPAPTHPSFQDQPLTVPPKKQPPLVGHSDPGPGRR